MYYKILRQADPKVREDLVKEFQAKAKLFNERLKTLSEKGPFFLGEEISYVEVCSFPILER